MKCALPELQNIINAIRNCIMSGTLCAKDVKTHIDGIIRIMVGEESGFALNGTAFFHFTNGLFQMDTMKD